MAEQKQIENQINNVLSGDALINASNLVAFLNEKEIALDSHGNNEEWAIGGNDGNGIGFMYISGDSQVPGPWTIWFNSCDFYDSGLMNNDVKETAWLYANACAHCHEGWENCGSSDRTILGKKFENLCHSPLMFTNPDANTLENIKKLIIMLK